MRTFFGRLCIPQQCLGPDAGDTLSRLATLTQMTELDLRGTFCMGGQKYDALLGPLSALARLQTLDLSDTDVGPQALQVVAKLKVLLPHPACLRRLLTWKHKGDELLRGPLLWSPMKPAINDTRCEQSHWAGERNVKYPNVCLPTLSSVYIQTERSKCPVEINELMGGACPP